MILLYFGVGYFLWQESEALSHQSNIPLSSKFKDAVKDDIQLIRKTQFIAKKGDWSTTADFERHTSSPIANFGFFAATAIYQ